MTDLLGLTAPAPLSLMGEALRDDHRSQEQYAIR